LLGGNITTNGDIELNVALEGHHIATHGNQNDAHVGLGRFTR